LDAAHKRLISAGIAVLGPVDHDGYVHSIYFFDPNGIRLELTAEIASEKMLSGYRAGARKLCDSWTLEKQQRSASH
jgi:catechol-2,3-dioxygenase